MKDPGLAITIIIAAATSGIIFAAYRAGRGRARGAAVNIALSLAVFVLVLSAAEMSFRALNVRPPDRGLARFIEKVRSGSSPGLHTEVTAGIDPITGFERNSLGFRDSDHTLEKPADSFRIICVGDSFMIGHGVKIEETFPRQLEAPIEIRFPSLEVETLNFAMTGMGAKDAAALLLYEAPAFRPDIILWGFVLNDVEYRAPSGAEPVYDGIGMRYDRMFAFLKSPVPDWLRHIFRLLDYGLTRYENSKLARQTISYYLDSYDPEKNAAGLERMKRDFRSVSEYYGARGVPVVLFIYPLLVDLDGGYPFKKIHSTVNEAAAGAGLVALDLLPVFTGRNPRDLWVHETDHHPNPAAQKIAADTVVWFLFENHITRPDEPRTAQWTTADIEPEAILLKAETQTGQSDCDAALGTLQPLLEAAPENPAAQYAAARAMADCGYRFAIGPKLHRLVNAGPLWRLKFRDIREKMLFN